MEITVAVVITAVTLIAGEVSKLFNINSKYIPVQNMIIALISIIVCIFFNVQNMSVLETIVTCIISSMSAGGIYDLTKAKED